MPIRIVHVDAFTARPFAGNPAAVCVLRETPTEQWMRDVAREMNLSETAFLTPRDEGYNLRWFTPAVEVDLCGHATVASAHVLWEDGHLPAGGQAHRGFDATLVGERLNPITELAKISGGASNPDLLAILEPLPGCPHRQEKVILHFHHEHMPELMKEPSLFMRLVRLGPTKVQLLLNNRPRKRLGYRTPLGALGSRLNLAIDT